MKRIETYKAAKTKINSLSAFLDIRNELQKEKIFRYMFIISIRKISLMIRVSRIFLDYHRDKNVFVFRECKESIFFKRFLSKWEDIWFEPIPYEEEDEEEVQEEKSKVTYISLENVDLTKLERRKPRQE